MLSHGVMPVIFKLDTKYLGLSTLIFNPVGLHHISNNESTFIPLDLKLSIANKEIVLSSVLYSNGGKPKIQLQLLEDEILGEDGLEFADCQDLDFDEQYFGRTDDQINEIEKEILQAESNNGDVFFLSGNVADSLDEPFLTIEEAFLQPIFLDSSWQNVYNLNYLKTDNTAESASQTKELFFKIESILNKWLAKECNYS